MRALGIAVLLSFLAHCSVANTAPTQLHAAASGDDVSVNVVGACPVRSLSGAIIELRSSDGATLARAMTGSDGSASFSNAVFQRTTFILVCHADYFCGAMTLTEHRGRAFFIALAPAMLSANESHKQPFPRSRRCA